SGWCQQSPAGYRNPRFGSSSMTRAGAARILRIHLRRGHQANAVFPLAPRRSSRNLGLTRAISFPFPIGIDRISSNPAEWRRSCRVAAALGGSRPLESKGGEVSRDGNHWVAAEVALLPMAGQVGTKSQTT